MEFYLLMYQWFDENPGEKCRPPDRIFLRKISVENWAELEKVVACVRGRTLEEADKALLAKHNLSLATFSKHTTALVVQQILPINN